ncbi:hypothetical protein LTR37_000331 [Vermiconidia calcicola]|uniref:Uncharacterized protein n=1 Tax=Vermiconidia calcicola TaxID=1690605 RepID=A0ACC3P131_9PEZI|nr:hypothetical protein LTR37_000331 [Vermiconidia calcicola]
MRIPQYSHTSHYSTDLQPVPGHDLGARAWTIARREALPQPQPWNGVVKDQGSIANKTYQSAAEPHFHGLTGVDQGMNYLLVNATIISLCVLLVITAAYRWFHMGKAHLRHLFTMGKWEDQRYWMSNHTFTWPWIKKHVIYAPLWRKRHNKEIRLANAITIGTLPSRYHTILIVAYLLGNLAACLALDYSVDQWSTVLAELRGRSGIFAGLNSVPTVLFAMRNNLLQPWLGVSYDTFNLLHRWCARVMIFETVTHFVAWGVVVAAAGGQEQLRLSLATSTSYTWGLVGTCAFCLIFIAAVGPLRHAFYEIFLFMHRILAFVGLIGMWIHVYKANLPMAKWMVMPFVFWGFEYIWRFARIVYFNFSRQFGFTTVTVEALPDACRVTFDLSRPWRWTPGCHVHAYLPALALWSSHPFSIAWAENRSRGAPLEIELEEQPRPNVEDTQSKTSSTSYQISDGKRHSIATRASTVSKTSGVDPKSVPEITHKSESVNITLPRDAAVTSISLIMRARGGMTKKLYERALAQPSGKFTTWGLIEGPYGGHESMSSYGTVILFAGGVGITHCIGYVHHLLLQHQAGITSTRKILLVWSVPNTESLEWVRILRMEGRREILRIQLFVTKPRHRNEVISSTGSVQMFPGRCAPETILRKEMEERIGAVGVTVCGPGPLGDAVRAAVRDVVEDGCIDFVEEAFTY